MEIIENIINNKFISSKLRKNLTVKFSKLSKKCRKLSIQKLKQYYIARNFDDNIILMMGGMENMIKIPILEWKDNFLGGTDYIDRITPEDLNHKIMMGIDRYHRPFICFRIKRDEEKYSVDTLFQRYTGETQTWTNGTCRNSVITESGYFYSGGKFRHEYVKQNIRNLLEDKGYILSPPILYSQKNIQKINILIN